MSGKNGANNNVFLEYLNTYLQKKLNSSHLE